MCLPEKLAGRMKSVFSWKISLFLIIILLPGLADYVVARPRSLSDELIRATENGATPEELQKIVQDNQGSEKPRIVIENASEGEFIRGEDDNRGLLILRGRIRVRLPDGVFTADTVIMDVDRQEIYGEGNLVYSSDGSGPLTEIKAERLIFDQRLGSGIVYNAEGYRDPVRFIGKDIRILSESRFEVSHAFFTACASERPHYNFTAYQVRVYENRRIVALGVLYHVGGVPLLPLPFLYASEWGTGIIAQAGHSDVQGYFLQTTYQFSDPTANFSAWRPMGYRFMFDHYENTGDVYGMEVFRFSPGMNYFVNVSGAKYTPYNLVGDYREKDQLEITNYVLQDDGTYGKNSLNWHKAFAIINLKGNDPEKNNTRNLQIRFEDYSHRLFEFEFGSRYQPTSTIPALYHNSESGRGIMRNSTDWHAVWNEVRDDLSIRVEASRLNNWYETGNYDTSRYEPVRDIVPSIDIEKRLYIGRLDLLDAPFYWDNTIHTDLTKTYSAGNIYRTVNNNRFESSFRTYMSWYPFISFRPKLGYGGQKIVPENTDASFERDAAYNSYEYWFTQDELVLGPDFLHVRAVYNRKESFQEEKKYNPLVNYTGYNSSVKIHETDVWLEFFPVTDVSFSLSSIYDHKTYLEEVPEQQRWTYPIFRSDIYLDFLNPFGMKRENTMSRKKVHFLGIRFTNDYIYDSINSRDHSNVFGVTLEAGGFDLWLLERLRFIELSYYWYHVYFDRTLDHMRYSMKADVQLTEHWFLEMELESRAVDTSRYRTGSTDRLGNNNYVALEHDVLYGTGAAGDEKRQKTVFNVGYFDAALIVDLHDWEMRFGYQLEQRSLYAGSNSLNIVNYYDNRVYFSMSFLRFDLGSISDRPSRFVINRQRVRSSDIGRISLSGDSY